MKLEFKSAFNIGEIVKFKGACQRFLINNILSETCPGGTQILYRGVMLFPKDSFRKTAVDNIEWVFDKEMNINENLLEKLV
jgi:hypothetical protein